jgi:AcrR family transcriptional regulator
MADDPQRGGREAVVRAAVELVGSVDLSQVLSFMSYRAVARQAHVRPGTVEYHFGSKHELDLATAVAGADLFDKVDHQPLLVALETLADGTGDLTGVATAMGRVLESVSATGPGHAAVAGANGTVMLVNAAAANDRHAVAVLRAEEERVVGLLSEMVAATAAATGRAWRPAYDARRFALLTQTLVGGFTFVRRYHPDNAPIDLFVDAWMRLFLGVTVDVTEAEPDTVDRVAARYGGDPEDVDADRRRLVDATRHVYAERGWQGLTEDAVAERSGLARLDVVRLVGDRRGLAAAVWASRLPRLERTLALLTGVASLEHVVTGYLGELVAIVREDMALSAAFLEGLWASTARGGGPADSHSMVPLTQLVVPLVAERADQLALDELDLAPEDVAALLVGYGLYLAFTRPGWPAERVVSVVVGTTYAGMAR